MSNQKKIFSIAFIVVFVVLWLLLLMYVTPAEIVEIIGQRHTLTLVFALGLVGGLSTATSVSFYSFLITAALGGVNPLFLGILGGLGLTLSDSIFFALGKSIKHLVESKWTNRKARQLSGWLKNKPRWMLPLLIFCYAGLTPLPNDIMTLALAWLHIKYRRVWAPLLAGNVFLSFALAWLAQHGIRLFY